MHHDNTFCSGCDRSRRIVTAVQNFMEVSMEALSQEPCRTDIDAFNATYVPINSQWCELRVSTACRELLGKAGWKMCLTNNNIIVCYPCLRVAEPVEPAVTIGPD